MAEQQKPRSEEAVVASDAAVPRRWHFWCHGCKDEKIETLADLDAEATAAVEWFSAHSPHGLGGFISPIDEERARHGG